MTEVRDVIKNAAIETLLSVRDNAKVEMAELREFADQIQLEFETGILSNDPQAVELLEARTRALIELTRLTALEQKREAVVASILTAFRITRTIVATL
jgi:hypothetical protein